MASDLGGGWQHGQHEDAVAVGTRWGCLGSVEDMHTHRSVSN
jgi:hypothetical protein